MEDLKKFVSQNRTLVWYGIAAMMFIFAAFCPQLGIDIDKRRLADFSFNGMDVLFGMELEAGKSELHVPGLAPFLMALMLLGPISLVWITARNNKPKPSKGNLPLILCGVCFVVGLLFMFMTKKAVVAAHYVNLVLPMKAEAGMYLYLFAAFAGAVIAFLTRDVAVAEQEEIVEEQKEPVEDPGIVIVEKKEVVENPNDTQVKIRTFVGRNRTLVWCGFGALLFVFAMFCPAITCEDQTIELGRFGEVEAKSDDKSIDGLTLLFDKKIEKVFVNGEDYDEYNSRYNRYDEYAWKYNNEDRMDRSLRHFGIESPRCLMILMLLVPIGLILTTVLKNSAFESRKRKLPLIFCGVCVALGLLFMMTLDDVTFCAGEEDGATLKTTVGFGIYLYFLTAIAATVIAYISKRNNHNQ